MTGIDLEAIGEAAEETVLIAAQNDRFRQTFGADFTIPGRIVCTQGVAAYGGGFQQILMVLLMQFDSFTEDNDPHGHRDFGILQVPYRGETVRVYWKIDLYDRACEYGSPAPADPNQTCRVLTLLLPSEY